MNLNKINRSDHFPEIELNYSVSREQVWNNLLNRMDEPRLYPARISEGLFIRMAFAASIALVIGLTGFFRLYTKTIDTPSGQHLVYSLPDNSTIELNAKSVIKFHPYWFHISRTLTLDGEAFFSVQKGNSFKVESKLGETAVLGTSFNIYSRNDDYNVTCFTGKVRVTSAKKNERVMLNPSEKAYLTKDGFLRFAQESNVLTAKSWRDNMFVFTGSSITYVLQEIERQYNIKIHYQSDPSLTYTGYFSRSLSGKEVLDLVCTSLGIKFDAKSDTEFLVN